MRSPPYICKICILAAKYSSKIAKDTKERKKHTNQLSVAKVDNIEAIHYTVGCTEIWSN